MAILNYTTDTPAEKSIEQIMAILRKKGARQILTQMDEDGHTVGIAFQIIGPDGLMGFKLPAKTEAVYRVLVKNKKYQEKTMRKGSRYVTTEEYYREGNEAQAERVAWRIVKDWLEAQLAILETEMVTFEQVFLPYATTRAGKTLYEEMKESGYLLLNKGNEE